MQILISSLCYCFPYILCCHFKVHKGILFIYTVSFERFLDSLWVCLFLHCKITCLWNSKEYLLCFSLVNFSPRDFLDYASFENSTHNHISQALWKGNILFKGSSGNIFLWSPFANEQIFSIPHFYSFTCWEMMWQAISHIYIYFMCIHICLFYYNKCVFLIYAIYWYLFEYKFTIFSNILYNSL